MAASRLCTRHVAVWLVALCAAASPSPAQDGATRLAPSSSWVLDYADDSCALRRTFGNGEDTVWLELRQFAPGEEFLVTVAGKPSTARKRTPKSSFLPGGPLREHPLAAYGQYGDDLEGVSFPDTLSPETRQPAASRAEQWSEEQRNAREQSVSRIYLQRSLAAGVTLETGELHQPMEAMRQCLDDLLRHWGIDPQVHRTLSKEAKPVGMARWGRPVQARFPRGLFAIGRTTRVTFRLLIDAEGKVESCRVLRPVADEEYESTICGTFLEQARYEPARDASGQPVKSYFLQHVLYRVL